MATTACGCIAGFFPQFVRGFPRENISTPSVRGMQRHRGWWWGSATMEGRGRVAPGHTITGSDSAWSVRLRQYPDVGTNSQLSIEVSDLRRQPIDTCVNLSKSSIDRCLILVRCGPTVVLVSGKVSTGWGLIGVSTIFFCWLEIMSGSSWKYHQVRLLLKLFINLIK